MKNIVLIYSLSILALIPLNTYAQERALNILYTGSLAGELEPCGCSPKTDFGGLARLSGYIAENRKSLSPYLLLDAGNFSADDTHQGRLKTDALLRAFSIMKYDSVSLQQRETSFSGKSVSSLIDKYKIPYVSSTHHYKLSITKNMNKLDVHISAYPGDNEKDQLNILMTALPLSECREMQGWDVIINSSGEVLDEPLSHNDTIIVTGYPKGKKLGILTLDLDNKGRITGFRHRWQPLGNDIKEDQKVRQVLDDYDSRVAKLLKERKQSVKETAYSGIAKCSECHQAFVDVWEKTGHARALSSLEKAGKSLDPECLECHTVGFGEEGGFFSMATTPELANVQCEACHGTGKDHLINFYKPMFRVSESVCLRCHTKERSPDFSYKGYVEKIKHW